MNNSHTQTSRMIAVEHVTLDKRNHTTQYELAPIEDIITATLSERCECCLTTLEFNQHVDGVCCACHDAMLDSECNSLPGDYDRDIF